MHELGKLSFRHEGAVWNAYYRFKDDDTVFLGSINMRLVQNDDRRQEFIRLMTNAMGDLIREISGQEPSWHQGPAPEHEKAGHS